MNFPARAFSCCAALLASMVLPAAAGAQSYLSINDWEIADVRRSTDQDGQSLILTTYNPATITNARKHGTLASLDENVTLRLAEYSTSIIPLAAVEWMRSNRRRLGLERARSDEDFVRTNMPVFVGSSPPEIYERSSDFRAEFQLVIEGVTHSSAVEWFDCEGRMWASFRRFSLHGSLRSKWDTADGYSQNILWEQAEPAQFFYPTADDPVKIAVMDAVCAQPAVLPSYYEAEREFPEEAAPRDANRWMSRFRYPARALRNGEQGRAAVKMLVTPEGRAVQCRVSSSSGSAILDDAACQNFERYARFHRNENALDAPLLTYASAVHWLAPEDSVPDGEEQGVGNPPPVIPPLRPGLPD